MKRKGLSFSIEEVVAFALAVFVGVIMISIILPLIMAQDQPTMCIGPFKGTASILADMTGVDLC